MRRWRSPPRHRRGPGKGYGNSEIADRLVVTERAVGNIFLKLGLPPEDSGHWRVLAVLTYLGAPRDPPRRLFSRRALGARRRPSRTL